MNINYTTSIHIDWLVAQAVPVILDSSIPEDLDVIGKGSRKKVPGPTNKALLPPPIELNGYRIFIFPNQIISI